MAELTAERIIDIHDDIIKEYGGTGGLLTQGTLELLVYKVNRENDAFRQAALTLYSIAAQHPFFDGNKRTAFATAENILRDAGYYLHADDDEVVNLMQKIGEYKCTVKTIEKWIREKARATSGPIF
ncbi:MAG: type II toxin-antitoxin system death-on-curing family toxin [Methanolobus sp.]|nr:type II toxin-antitoxin system death-on-curing family toxin [Methanolobus sp.]